MLTMLYSWDGVPENDMPGLFALADVLFVHLKNLALFRITIPHKILSYMSSGRPVLAAVAVTPLMSCGRQRPDSSVRPMIRRH